MSSETPHTAPGAYRYLFGPVPSRRLGLSLGVDLLTPKTCTYDCLFCEVGRTTCRTLERREYAPVDGILGELSAWAEAGGRADYVTVAGSGEPTLHSRFGDVLDGIRRIARVRSAILTNGSLLHLPEVREAAGRADLVKTSLSSWDEGSFLAINRPVPGLTHSDVLDGLRAFRESFHGTLWVEVFVVAGVNDDADGIRKIAAVLSDVRPDRIHLNTVIRPPAEPLARAVDEATLTEWAGLFTPKAEVTAAFCKTPGKQDDADAARVSAMLSRRPCTGRDVALAFGLAEDAALGLLENLVRGGVLRREKRGGETYFMLSRS